MTSLHKWIITIIVIIVTAQPIKTMSITKTMAQHMKMVPAPTQPMKRAPTMTEILQLLTNKR